MKAAIKRNFPLKSRDNMPVWSEFNQLATKYGALNLCHGTPGVDAPEFLKENLIKATMEGHNQYTLFLGHPLLRDKVSEHFSSFFKKSKQGKPLNPNTEI